MQLENDMLTCAKDKLNVSNEEEQRRVDLIRESEYNSSYGDYGQNPFDSDSYY